MPGWILESADPPFTLRLPPGAVKTVGRTARADFILEAALVSRLHCRLTAGADDQLTVEDLESTNGVQVNGRRVTRATLRTGDTLTIGRVEFRVNGLTDERMNG
jgi:ABC transport system ATP-binding/permease protein